MDEKSISFVRRQQVERLLGSMFVNSSEMDEDKKWWKDSSFVLLNNENKKLSADPFLPTFWFKNSDVEEEAKGFVSP